jgi:hypothetical protein
MKAGLHRFGE